MAYSDFDLKKVRNNFGLQIDEQPDLFAAVTPVQPSVTLVNVLAEHGAPSVRWSRTIRCV